MKRYTFSVLLPRRGHKSHWEHMSFCTLEEALCAHENLVARGLKVTPIKESQG